MLLESVLIIRSENASPEQWRIASRGMMEFWSRESESCLGSAFASWYAARPTRRKPALNPFLGDMPAEFSDLRIPPADRAFHPTAESSFSADVRKPHPMNFVIAARDYPPIRIGDMSSPLLQRALMSDLLVCRGFRYPLYQEIEQESAGLRLQYRRLLLPVVDKSGGVNKIYAFCRPLAGNSQSLHEQIARLTWSELP